MSLSPNVARPPTPTKTKDRSTGERRNSPFGGMNRRTANIHRAQRPPSAAALKRSGSEKAPQKEKETFHALKMQKTLSDVSYGRRNAIKSKLTTIDDFRDFNLLPAVEEAVATQALSDLTHIEPTPIQRVAIPSILGNSPREKQRNNPASITGGMQQFLLAAETGSGKTLAYLLPVLDAVKRTEATEVERQAQARIKAEEEAMDAGPNRLEPPPVTTAKHATAARPKAIVLLPTSELVSQVGLLAKKLSHTTRFRTAMISSAYSAKVIQNRVFAPAGIDLLVSTPQLLASISNSDPNILSRVTHLVIDEADSLLDRSFAPSTSTIIDKTTPSLKQLILCSATIPRSLDSFLLRRFPDMRRLVTPNLHAIPRRVQLGVVDIDKQPYQGNRLLACADTVWSIGKAALRDESSLENQASSTKLLVFVNERETCKEVAEYLESKGIEAIALSRDTPEQRQSEILQEFTTRETSSSTSAKNEDSDPAFDEPSEPAENAPIVRHHSSLGRGIVPTSNAPRKLINTKVLVATDLGSRGIDTLAVRHVILYDVPHSTIDFIHRLGRTGRMGRRGRGIVLVGKHDRKDVVREVREGMFKGQALI